MFTKRMKKMVTCMLLAGMLVSVSGCKDKASVKDTQKTEQASEQKDGKSISFQGKDIEGNETDSSSIFKQHKVTMINVWATYCQPCIKEMPDLEKLSKKLKEKDIQIIGILSDVVASSGKYDQSNWDLGKQIVKETGITYPTILCDTSAFTDKIALDAVPTTFFVNANGEIIGKTQVGSVSNDAYEKLALEALELAE